MSNPTETNIFGMIIEVGGCHHDLCLERSMPSVVNLLVTVCVPGLLTFCGYVGMSGWRFSSTQRRAGVPTESVR